MRSLPMLATSLKRRASSASPRARSFGTAASKSAGTSAAQCGNPDAHPGSFPGGQGPNGGAWIQSGVSGGGTQRAGHAEGAVPERPSRLHRAPEQQLSLQEARPGMLQSMGEVSFSHCLGCRETNMSTKQSWPLLLTRTTRGALKKSAANEMAPATSSCSSWSQPLELEAPSLLSMPRKLKRRLGMPDCRGCKSHGRVISMLSIRTLQTAEEGVPQRVHAPAKSCCRPWLQWRRGRGPERPKHSCSCFMETLAG